MYRSVGVCETEAVEEKMMCSVIPFWKVSRRDGDGGGFSVTANTKATQWGVCVCVCVCVCVSDFEEALKDRGEIEGRTAEGM